MRQGHFIRYNWVSAFLLVSGLLQAQYDPQFSQYMLNRGTFNPASIGEGEELRISLLNRQQWVSIDGAPTTFLLQGSIPKKWGTATHGFGFLLMNETIGLFRTQLLQVQYAFKKELAGGEMSFGLQGGMLQQDFDATNIYIPTSDYHSQTDQSKPSGNLSGKVPDFSFGCWYDHTVWYAGLSASHLLESTIRLKEGETTTDETNKYQTHASRTYYLTGGYNINLSNALYTLQPSILLKSDLVAWQTDLSLRLNYQDRYWGMVGWRPGDAVIVSAGIRLEQGLSIGYAYDISTKTTGGYSGGSHEIFLGIARRLETAKVSKKQKSVRIL